MVEITDVGIAAGVPNSGDGTVPTLAKVMPQLGAVNETAPATDTAPAGLNGRLQKIAQNITAQFTALLGRLPAVLGAGGGLKVDGSGTALPVSGAVTATVSGSVAVSSLPALPTGANTIGAVGIVGTVGVSSLPALPTGANNIGDVDVLTVPADPFGVSADAASATGSISAKLRALATAWGITAIDFGAGVLSARTLRTISASDDPLMVVLGAKTDAKNVATDATSTSLMAVMKQLSASMQALQAAIVAAGSSASSAAMPVVLASDQKFFDNDNEPVAASSTTQALGATGAVGDWLSHLLVIPTSTSPQAIAIKDGSNAAITVFAGGASSLSNLVPFIIAVGIRSKQGAWQVTTGTGASVLACGKFT